MLIIGRGLQTIRTHGFVSVCLAPWAEQGGVDDRFVEAWSLFDIHGEYRGQPLDEPFPMTSDKEGGC